MEELIELYTPSGKASGRIIRRGDACPAGLFFPVVCIWVEDAEKHLLVTLRDPAKKASPLKWENPGGACRAGESLAEGACRELREEAGISVLPGQLKLLSKMTQYGCLVVTYFVRVAEAAPQVTLQAGETCDFRWVDASALRVMLRMGDFAEVIAKQIRSYERKLMREL